MFDRVYTVGCFDYFHHGHEVILNKLKEFGKTVIVGIHDDESIEQLKKLQPDQHENLVVRMEKVKKFCDIVFVIPHKDPTFFLKCMIRQDDNHETACFIRGDDMPNFPGKELVQNIMSIKYVPYTLGISSTAIRNDHKNKLLE